MGGVRYPDMLEVKGGKEGEKGVWEIYWPKREPEFETVIIE